MGRQNKPASEDVAMVDLYVRSDSVLPERVSSAPSPIAGRWRRRKINRSNDTSKMKYAISAG